MQSAEAVAEGLSQDLVPFLKPFSVYSYLARHITEKARHQARDVIKRLFLRRNLSYYAPNYSAKYLRAEASHFVTVQLTALHLAPAYSQGLVLYVAVCRALWQHGSQVLVPLAAKAALLRPGAAGTTAVRLPVTQPAGYGDELQDLVVLLLHEPSQEEGRPALSPEYRLLDALALSGALAERGGKSISCDLARLPPFAWPRDGAGVLHFTVGLRDRQQHQAAVELLQGRFRTHEPEPGVLDWASLTITQRGLSEAVRLEYQIEARPAGGEAPLGQQQAQQDGMQQGQQAQQQQEQLLQERQQNGAAAPAAAAGGGGSAGAPQRPSGGIPWLPPKHKSSAQQRRQQPQNGSLARQGQQQQQQQLGGQLTGLKRKREAARTRGPPGPQERDAAQRSVVVSLYSMEGQLLMEDVVQGCYCLVCNLRCRSFTALRQHLEASHDYFEFAFADDQPDLAPEVALRCRRDLYDESGEFLPARDLSNGDQNQILKPWQSDIFCYACPPAERGRRWLPGFAPRFHQFRTPAAQQAQLRRRQQQAQLAASGGLQQLAHDAAAPAAAQHSGLARSESAGAVLASEGSIVDVEEEGEEEAGGQEEEPSTTSSDSEDEEHEEEEEEEEEERAAPQERQPPAAPRAGGTCSARGRQPRKFLRGRGRPGRTAVSRAKPGLALLTPDGRLKYYHSRACVSMTHEELLGDQDSDDDTDEAEWKRDCYERLYEAAGGSVGSTAQRDFMLAWDWHLQRNPLHADADVPSSLRQFKAAAAPTGGAAFHRQFAVMVTNLWRYRLLTPDQAYELLQA